MRSNGRTTRRLSTAVQIVIVAHALLFHTESECHPDIDPGKAIFERFLQLADPGNAMKQELDPLELGSFFLNDYTNWASLMSKVRKFDMVNASPPGLHS